MALKNNTILITGGTSGLGLEMAKEFIRLGNKVIVCSSTIERLEATKKLLPSVIAYQCDLSIAYDRAQLCDWIKNTHPELGILINNAAIVHQTSFIDDEDSISKSEKEMAINLSAPMHLIKLLFPVLINNPHPKIINITTGLVYVPRVDYPFYNAMKSALHSFTMVLRHQLKDEPIKIIEVLFPSVDTPWHRGNPPKTAITSERAINEMMTGLQSNKDEIKVGRVKILYFLTRIAPEFAFLKVNA